MNDKLNKKENNTDNKDNGEMKLSNLKNENKKLQVDIRKYKDDSNMKKNDLKKIIENKEIPNKIKIKSDEIRNLTNQKYECFNKIKMCIKSLDNITKEVTFLEEISNKKYKEDKNENSYNKIKHWIDIIKSDLNGSQEEILSKIDKNETNFMKEISKTELNNINSNSHRIKSSSFDEMKKDNNNNEETNTNVKNKKNAFMNNLKNSYKGIFGKYNYFKQKPNSSMNKKYKLTKINISSEENKTNKYKNTSGNIDLDSIIQKDYEETNDNEYRELLDKKSQYLETNVRLERNIKEIEKTKKSKILNISYTVKENEQRLKELKAQNDLLEQEIINLQNLYKLTIDKEKLKNEIKEKERKTKKLRIDEENNNNNEKKILETSLATENNILNELKESNKSLEKNKTKREQKKLNKNRSGYVDDFIPDKNVIETREERLRKIKEKYLDENMNELEMNNDKQEENEIKMNNENKDKDENINNNVNEINV